MATNPKQVPVSFAQPFTYFTSFMINRFFLAKDDGFTLGYFGLVSKSNVLLDQFTCLFPQDTLTSLRENLVTYSETLGPPIIRPPAWTPKGIDASAERVEAYSSNFAVVDFIHLTNWEDAHAEICFWNYSKAKLADHLRGAKDGGGKDAGAFPTWGIAILRSSIDLQRSFLEGLYPV
jgi:hypothetical protein